jgi:hypothetical protein
VTLGVDSWFGSRGSAWFFRSYQSGGLNLPVQETVGIGMDLLVALDAISVEAAHTRDCLYKDL